MFHIVKDEDGNERLMTDEEYARYKSLNAFGDFAGAVAGSAYQQGGLLHAANCLLLIVISLLFTLAWLAYDLFPPGTTTLEKIGTAVSGLFIFLGLILKTRWIAFLVKICTVVWLLSVMLVK